MESVEYLVSCSTTESFLPRPTNCYGYSDRLDVTAKGRTLSAHRLLTAVHCVVQIGIEIASPYPAKVAHLAQSWTGGDQRQCSAFSILQQHLKHGHSSPSRTTAGRTMYWGETVSCSASSVGCLPGAVRICSKVAASCFYSSFKVYLLYQRTEAHNGS